MKNNRTIEELAESLFSEKIVRRGTDCYKWDEYGNDDTLPLWVADMDFRVAPAIQEALARRVEHGVFGYALVPERYYDAVISWFDRRHDWKIEREWIQYTTGVVPALSVVIKALTSPGDGVIVQTPAYNCFFSSVRNNGCTIVENKLVRDEDNRYHIDYDNLEALCANPANKLLLLCNPHNPTGRVWTKEELIRVNDICMKHGVRVLADEIHCELVLGGKRYQPFAAVSEECLNNCVVCCSPSKSFNTAGLHIANIICTDATIREKIDRAINDNEVCDIGPIGVDAVIAAYNESEEWLDALLFYIDRNFHIMDDFFRDNLPHCRVTPLEGTYLAWVDCTWYGMESDALCDRLLEEQNVKFNGGAMYGEHGGSFIRINLATTKDILIEALQRLKRGLDAIRK